MNGEGDNDERGRTTSISGTLQPVWRDPPEVFIVTAVEELILEVGKITETYFFREVAIPPFRRALMAFF